MIPLFATRGEIEALIPRVAERQREVLDSGRYILGPEVEAFEQEFAAYLGAGGCVGVANGTDAITIALRAAGVRPGDEVVVPAVTFYASAEAVVNAMARPVFCDVDPRTFNMTAATVEPVLTDRTAALLPVHLFGNPAPMAELNELAAARGLRVIEDAAQAAGAAYQGRKAGTLGHAATFSFFPAKNLGGFGDGGAIVSDDENVLAAARRLRFHGSEDKRTHTDVGYNSRLDALQAAGLRVLLPELDRWTARRREVAAAYGEAGLGDYATLPLETAGGVSCYHLYVVTTPDRDGLRTRLAEAGVESREYYPVPMHRQPGMAAFDPPETLPDAERLGAEHLALPMGPGLSGEDVGAVVDAVRDALVAA